MFDGTVPANFKTLKKIYSGLWGLSLDLMYLATDIEDDGLPKKYQQGARTLDERLNDILHLFDDGGVLTKEESAKLRNAVMERRHKPRAR